MLELWGMQNTPLLPTFSDPLWPRVVAPDSLVLFDPLIEPCELMLNWIVWNITVYMYKMDLALNIFQWLIWHKTKQNQNGSISPLDWNKQVLPIRLRMEREGITLIGLLQSPQSFGDILVSYPGLLGEREIFPFSRVRGWYFLDSWWHDDMVWYSPDLGREIWLKIA